MTDLEFGSRMHPDLYPFYAQTLGAEKAVTFSAEGSPLTRMDHNLVLEFDVSAEIVYIPVSEETPDVKAFIFRPEKLLPNAPAILYYHGGGYSNTNPEAYSHWCCLYANELGAVVVCPDYRKAPENPYPAALEDGIAVLNRMAANTENLGVDPERIAVAGPSAGGGLTIATCLYVRDFGGPKIAFQMPLYPTMDDRLETRSSHEILYEGLLCRSVCENIWDMYLGEGHKEREIPVYASPSRCRDYSGLPPCYSYVGNLDPHRDETIAYCQQLYDDGVIVSYSVYEGCFHGFDLMAHDQAKIADMATEVSLYTIKTALHI